MRTFDATPLFKLDRPLDVNTIECSYLPVIDHRPFEELTIIARGSYNLLSFEVLVDPTTLLNTFYGHGKVTHAWGFNVSTPLSEVIESAMVRWRHLEPKLDFQVFTVCKPYASSQRRRKQTR